jgi:hypothetical protein
MRLLGSHTVTNSASPYPYPCGRLEGRFALQALCEIWSRRPVEGEPTNLAGEPAVARENSKGSEDPLPLRASSPSLSSFRKPPPTQGPALQVRAGRVEAPLAGRGARGVAEPSERSRWEMLLPLWRPSTACMHGLPPLASRSRSRCPQLLKCSW